MWIWINRSHLDSCQITDLIISVQSCPSPVPRNRTPSPCKWSWSTGLQGFSTTSPWTSCCSAASSTTNSSTVPSVEMVADFHLLSLRKLSRMCSRTFSLMISTPKLSHEWDQKLCSERGSFAELSGHSSTKRLARRDFNIIRYLPLKNMSWVELPPMSKAPTSGLPGIGLII